MQPLPFRIKFWVWLFEKLGILEIIQLEAQRVVELVMEDRLEQEDREQNHLVQ